MPQKYPGSPSKRLTSRSNGRSPINWVSPGQATTPFFLRTPLLRARAAPERALRNRRAGKTDFCFNWTSVHWSGVLSGRQRKIVVPCLKRPPLKWSYDTSTTSFGLTGTHSLERLVDQRLGPPGVEPVKLLLAIPSSSKSVSFGLSASFSADENPTW